MIIDNSQTNLKILQFSFWIQISKINLSVGKLYSYLRNKMDNWLLIFNSNSVSNDYFKVNLVLDEQLFLSKQYTYQCLLSLIPPQHVNYCKRVIYLPFYKDVSCLNVKSFYILVISLYNKYVAMYFSKDAFLWHIHGK